MAYVEIEVGSVWRLKSGRMVEIEKVTHGGRVAAFYVDNLGRPAAPTHRNTVTLSTMFIDVYATRVILDKVD